MELELERDADQISSGGRPDDSPETLYHMATAYYEDVSDPTNERKAYRLYKQSASQGHALAQFGLGVLYETGYGTEYDPQKAAYWYKKAVAQGVDAAMVNLARLKIEGDIEQDYDGAKRLLEKAERRNNADARELLAYLDANKPWTGKQKIATTVIVLSIIPWTIFAVSFIMPIFASMGLGSVRLGILLIIALAPALFLIKLVHGGDDS